MTRNTYFPSINAIINHCEDMRDETIGRGKAQVIQTTMIDTDRCQELQTIRFGQDITSAIDLAIEILEG